MNSVISTPFTFEQNMRLIDLAYDCVFLNSEEKETVTGIIEEKFKEGIVVNVTDVFKSEEFVSDKRIQHLLDLDEHLLIRRRDLRFGQIALANGMTSEENIANALKYQETYFKKNKMNMRIGDILVGNGSISQADQIAVLLTQNRIKDEELIGFIENLGQNQREKEGINKRFGVLGIKKELVTLEQVKTALGIQAEERKAQGGCRFIGEILKETAQLSDDDLMDILFTQKQFEKRRLDLEKALYSVKEEIKLAKKLGSFFECNISGDGLEASVKKIKESEEEIPVYEFIIWLKRVGIQHGIVDDATLEEFIKKGDFKSSAIVARGYPPESCVNESLEVYFEARAPGDPAEAGNAQTEHEENVAVHDDGDEETEQSGEPEAEQNVKNAEQTETGEKDEDGESGSEQEKSDTDESEENLDDEDEKQADSTFIAKGGLMAEIIPGREGRPGKSVLGYPVLPGRIEVCRVTAGSGVEKRGTAFFATIDGRPVLKNSSILMVEPVSAGGGNLTLMENIDDDTKDTYKDQHLELNGNISSKGVIRCRDLIVNGSVSGSIICSGDLDVRGSVSTIESKSEEADEVENVSRASILCSGAVKISKSVVNASMQAGDEIKAYNSEVIGSDLLSFAGIGIKDVSSGENGPSTLQFGLKPGDKSLPLDQAVESKSVQLSVLRKEPEIDELTKEYEKELEEARGHETEQAIFKNLVEIIEGPELFQYESLQEKIDYLFGLPEFSSIRAYYLKLPDNEMGLQILEKILQSTENLSVDEALEYFKGKIEPEPESEEEDSPIVKIEKNYKARLAAVDKEVANEASEIAILENDIKGLQALKARLETIHLKTLARSASFIKIKNKCEKGTIIKGKIAKLVLDRTLYKISFQEVINNNGKAQIVITSY